MIRGDKCFVGPCNNDKRMRNKLVIMDHVSELKCHRFPTNNEVKKNIWDDLVSTGRDKFTPSEGSCI